MRLRGAVFFENGQFGFPCGRFKPAPQARAGYEPFAPQRALMAKSDKLVDLVATHEPETTAEGETVVVTAPVVFANDPDSAGQIRLSLTIQQAAYLAAQIQPALVIARVHSRGK